MGSAKRAGRIIGVMLLAQMAGLIVPFVLLHALAASPAEFIANAPAIASQVNMAVFLLFANGALTIGIAIATWGQLRRHSEAMALLLVAVSIIWFSLQAVDNAYLLTQLSMRQQYAAAVGQAELHQALAATVGSTRKWVHYTELFVIDAWIFLFYASLFRFALVPRALAGFCLITVLLHFTGITLPLFLGQRGVTLLGASMALGHVALALWLMVKGLKEPRHAVDSRRAGDLPSTPS